MVFVGSWFGEYFNPAVTQFVVLRREWILIDPDLADRSLWWKLTRGETVNVHLSAVRSSGRPGESLQIRLKLVRIIGESFQFFAGNDDGPGVIRRIDIDGGRSIRDLHFLRFDFDRQRNIQPQGLIRDIDAVIFIK